MSRLVTFLRRPLPALGLVTASLALTLGLPRLFIEAEDVAARLAHELTSLTWEEAALDLDLSLRLSDVTLDGLRAVTLATDGRSLSLGGVSGEAASLTNLRALELTDGQVSLRGRLELPGEAAVEGRWSTRPGGHALDGRALLSTEWGEVEVETRWLLDRDGVVLEIRHGTGRLYLECGPPWRVVGRGLEARELLQLLAPRGLEARGVVDLAYLPVERTTALRWRELELRSPGQPGWLGLPAGGCLASGGGWVAGVAGWGWLSGDGDVPRAGSLSLKLDGDELTAMLPLGWSTRGWLVFDLELESGRPPEVRLSATELRLSTGVDPATGADWWIEGELAFSIGLLSGAGRIDTGGGVLDYAFQSVEEPGGRVGLSGDGVELSRTLAGAADLGHLLNEYVGRWFPGALEAAAPLRYELELREARWEKWTLGDLTGTLTVTGRTDSFDLRLGRQGGRGELRGGREDDVTRLTARWEGLPAELFNALGLEGLGLRPTAGDTTGRLELRLTAGTIQTLELELEAKGLAAALPRPLATLWSWSDTGREPPSLEDAELSLGWRSVSQRGSASRGRLSVILTSPDLRVTLAPTSTAAPDGELAWRGVIEFPPRVAAAMKRRGVLIFGTPSGWGAKPFLLEGTWRDPRVRLDPLGSRELSAAEPPPGVLDW